MPQNIHTIVFKGRRFERQTVCEIIGIVKDFPGLSRIELSSTICELFFWKRKNGRLKTVESGQFLEHLESLGFIQLPKLKPGGIRGQKHVVGRTQEGGMQDVLSCSLDEVGSIDLHQVTTRQERNLWYEYVDRYHYLGYQLPFGAQIRYFIKADGKKGRILGCLQFSSPAWKMASRDRWIGWSDEQRRKNLQKLVNNSRFLILPWVKVKNLASSVLSLAARRLPDDWNSTYKVRPVLLETLVDSSRFQGTCYKASNWFCLGETTGRGRMDQSHDRHGKAPKQIFLLPLSRRFQKELLCRGET